MTGLIGVERPNKKGMVPNMVTPEEWRQFITARVVWKIERLLPGAKLVHSSIDQGTYATVVAESTPFCCHPAIHTVENIFQVDPEDTAPLFLRVPTGALCLAPMGYDQEALFAAVDRNTDMAIDTWKKAIESAGEDAVADVKRKHH